MLRLRQLLMCVVNMPVQLKERHHLLFAYGAEEPVIGRGGIGRTGDIDVGREVVAKIGKRPG
jgi:hypothetical protein